MKLLRLFGASFSLSLRQQLAFRVDLLFSLFVTATGIASGIAALGIVYARTETLGGWARGEAIVLLGTFQLLSIALNTFVAPNRGRALGVTGRRGRCRHRRAPRLDRRSQALHQRHQLAC